MNNFQTIGVVGGGAWGTALAQSACLAGKDVLLWAREAETVAAINDTHENSAFLNGVQLHERLRASNRLQDLAKADALLLVTPAQFTRTICKDLKPYISQGTPLIICSKGIEVTTGKLLSDVLLESIPEAVPAILSGPSFASDVARGLPTAVTLATSNEALSKSLSQALSHKALRPYWSDDLVGVQIGGAVKNVLAIAAGIVVGKGLGASAHAGLISRGFAELNRFAISYGANPKTLSGLSGLGDLVLTCSSPQSRNMSLGIELGKGKRLDDILKTRTSVSEGVYTAKAVASIAKERNLQMPISEAIAAIVSDRVSVDEAIDTLLSRPLKAEQ